MTGIGAKIGCANPTKVFGLSGDAGHHAKLVGYRAVDGPPDLARPSPMP